MEGLNEIRRRMAEESYIADDALAVTLLIALKLGRPLLIEGAAGVGKTEVAKVAAKALGRELVRMQCYEGLDESKALYEWNYQKQLLAIQMGAQGMSDLFGEDYLLERPLLKSIRSAEPVVLLIDEIDKADAEFEAFLAGAAVEMQGDDSRIRHDPREVDAVHRADQQPHAAAVRGASPPLCVHVPRVPGRRARGAHPAIEAAGAGRRAGEAGRARGGVPEAERARAEEAVHRGEPRLASALIALGAGELDDETCEQTIGFALKNHEDIKEIMADDEFIRCLVQ